MFDLWGLISYIITTGVGGLFGWLFSRRKYNAEVDTTLVGNFDASLDAYKKMYEGMIEDLKEQNGDLKKEVVELRAELADNRKQLMTLTNFVLANAIAKADSANENLEELRNIIK